MIIVLLLMIASLVLVFLGLATSITTRLQDTSPFVHMVLTYAGLLVTLLSHIVAFLYIVGLRNLLMAEPPDADDDVEYGHEGARIALDAVSSPLITLAFQLSSMIGKYIVSMAIDVVGRRSAPRPNGDGYRVRTYDRRGLS